MYLPSVCHVSVVALCNSPLLPPSPPPPPHCQVKVALLTNSKRLQRGRGHRPLQRKALRDPLHRPRPHLLPHHFQVSHHMCACAMHA